LTSGAVVKRYLSGQLIFNRGDPGLGCYVIAQGKARLFVSGNGSKEQLLAILRPGDTFGESGLFLLGGYPSTAQALEKTETYFFSKERLFRVMSQSASLHEGISRGIAQKLFYLARIFEARTIRAAPARLASFILSHQEASGKDRLSLSKGQMASFIGTSPETVAKALKALKDLGAVTEERPYLTVRDKGILGDLVRDDSAGEAE
jgi:CRP/FNR family transcriptional regulator